MASASAAGAGPSASPNTERLPPIDLRPYGLNLVLDESLSQDVFEARLTKDIVLNKVNADDKGFIFANSVKELKYSKSRSRGEGGYGVVTQCTNSNLCRQVAIKKVFFKNKPKQHAKAYNNMFFNDVLAFILSRSKVK